jgi:hypothetical protein
LEYLLQGRRHNGIPQAGNELQISPLAKIY